MLPAPLRPPRDDIAAPPFPSGVRWIGQAPAFERVLAADPALVHFFDFAQLNCVRALPYLTAWHQRYRDSSLHLFGVHSPRFSFTRSAGAVAESLPRLGVNWPVAVDAEMLIWRDYGSHGWPSLFLWGRGGRLRWHHLGEGEYIATEVAIREALEEAGTIREWPPLLDTLRPSDAPGAEVVAPTHEVFPGGGPESPWLPAAGAGPLTVEYEAGGAYVAADGSGEIALSVDGEPVDPVAVANPGLTTLIEHPLTERHSLELAPSPGLEIYSLQFAPAPP
jgi:hypothetical protein